MRATSRRPPPKELRDSHPDASASPLEEAIGRETLKRYEKALLQLRREEREAIVARVELQQSYAEVAASLGKSSPDAARMMVARALVRVAEEMDHAR